MYLKKNRTMNLEVSKDYSQFFIGVSVNTDEIEQDQSVSFSSLILFDFYGKQKISLIPYYDVLSNKISYIKALENGEIKAKILNFRFPYQKIKINLPDCTESYFLGITGSSLEQTIDQFLKQITPVIKS